MKMLYLGLTAAGLVFSASFGPVVFAQAPAGGGEKRKAIETEFQNELIKAEKAKIQRLGELAASQPKEEAVATYEDLFRFAIGSGLYEAAEPHAAKALESDITQPEVILLAQLVKLVAQAQRGDYDGSLASLAKSIEHAGEDKAVLRKALPLPARISLVNTYVGRLIHAGRFDVAKKALTMVGSVAKDQEVKDLVAARLRQVSMIGEAAPEIAGNDLEGNPVKLSDLKGNVVLVLFWATWCAPNEREAADFARLVSRYRGKGFRIIGVNLDTLSNGGQSIEAVTPLVRRFVIEHNVNWPTLINGPGAADHAKTYGVTQIPCDFLVDKDGKAVALDLDVISLEKKLDTLFGK